MGSAAACGAAVAYPAYIEPRWLEVTRTEVTLPAKQPGRFRVLHLSDLHATPIPLSLIDWALQLGLAEKPDLICLTGDYITSQIDFEPGQYASVLAQLSAAAPTFAVLGNHDGGLWSRHLGGYSDHEHMDRILERAGIRLLHNSCRRVRIHGNGLNLIGVGDLWAREVLPGAAFRNTDPELPSILLAHNPDTKDILADRQWDLMLSGHTHGGTVMVPFQGPRFAPVKDRRFISGLGCWNGRQIYVTRGVGGGAYGIRFQCRPEVTILDVELQPVGSAPSSRL